MTMPNERRMSVIYVREFLLELLDAEKTPKVSEEMRRRAKSLLKHFPVDYDMEKARKAAPGLFGEWDS